MGVDTHLLAETTDEGRLLFVTATSEALPVACVAQIERLDEFSTDCGMVRPTLGLSESVVLTALFVRKLRVHVICSGTCERRGCPGVYVFK